MPKAGVELILFRKYLERYTRKIDMNNQTRELIVQFLIEEEMK